MAAITSVSGDQLDTDELTVPITPLRTVATPAQLAARARAAARLRALGTSRSLVGAACSLAAAGCGIGGVQVLWGGGWALLSAVPFLLAAEHRWS